MANEIVPRRGFRNYLNRGRALLMGGSNRASSVLGRTATAARGLGTYGVAAPAAGYTGYVAGQGVREAVPELQDAASAAIGAPMEGRGWGRLPGVAFHRSLVNSADSFRNTPLKDRAEGFRRGIVDYFMKDKDQQIADTLRAPAAPAAPKPTQAPGARPLTEAEKTGLQKAGYSTVPETQEQVNLDVSGTAPDGSTQVAPGFRGRLSALGAQTGVTPQVDQFTQSGDVMSRLAPRTATQQITAQGGGYEGVRKGANEFQFANQQGGSGTFYFNDKNITPEQAKRFTQYANTPSATPEELAANKAELERMDVETNEARGLREAEAIVNDKSRSDVARTLAARDREQILQEQGLRRKTEAEIGAASQAAQIEAQGKYITETAKQMAATEREHIRGQYANEGRQAYNDATNFATQEKAYNSFAEMMAGDLGTTQDDPRVRDRMAAVQRSGVNLSDIGTRRAVSDLFNLTDSLIAQGEKNSGVWTLGDKSFTRPMTVDAANEVLAEYLTEKTVFGENVPDKNAFPSFLKIFGDEAPARRMLALRDTYNKATPEERKKLLMLIQQGSEKLDQYGGLRTRNDAG